jgi:hypothetical protein
MLPTLSRTARPHEALSSVCRWHRPADPGSALLATVGGLEVARASSRGPRDVVRWRAPRARWPRIVGRSRSPEATPRQGEGFSPSPCSAAGAAAECVPPPTAPTPRSGSCRRWVCRCASRARQGGTDLVVVPPQPSEQGAATDPALGAMNTMRGGGSLSDCAPAPAAGGRDSEHRARTNARVRKRSMRGIVLAATAASAGDGPDSFPG